MQPSAETKIYLAIFVYNCEKQIQRVISEIDEKLIEKVHKILVIDNQSSDNSFQVAQEAIKLKNSSKFELIKNPKNVGLGGSHKVAFKKAFEEKAEYLAILHGDHQARAVELHQMFDAVMKQPELMAVLGSRFMLKSKRPGYSLLRTFGNVVLNFIYSILTFRITKDLGSGINVFKVLPSERIKNYSDGFTFNMDLLLDYYKHGDKVLFFPISWYEVDQISNAKTFKVGWTALKTVIKWRINQF